MKNVLKRNKWHKIATNASFKFLKLKYNRGTKKFSLSTELVTPKKFGPPSLIWGNLKDLSHLNF